MNINIENGIATITMPEDELFVRLKDGNFVPQEPIPEKSASGTDVFMNTSVLLNRINMPSHVKGYDYIREAVVYCYNNPPAISQITKTLYPTIAKNNNDTPSRVERSIRYALSLVWNPHNVEVLNRICGTSYTVGGGSPKNSEFIALMVKHMQLQALRDKNCA